jgi:hypothetical protein
MAGELVQQHDGHDLDAHEGQHAGEDLVQRHMRRTHALQVERGHRHRRAQERGLQVQRHQQAEEQRVDAEVVQQRDEDRHEDHDDLGPLQRPAQDEDDHLAQHQELGLAEVHRHDPRSTSSCPPSSAKAAEKIALPTNSQHTMALVLAVRNTLSLSTVRLNCR